MPWAVGGVILQDQTDWGGRTQIAIQIYLYDKNACAQRQDKKLS